MYRHFRSAARVTGSVTRPAKVTIASGAQIDIIDLDAFFGGQPGRARVPGAADAAPARGLALSGSDGNGASAHDDAMARKARTVALSDGTRITFAAALGVGEMEPA